MKISIRTATLGFATMIVASCTPPPQSSQPAFLRLVEGRTAGAPQACVRHSMGEAMVAADSGTLVFTSGATVYVNHLGLSCPNIGPLNTLIVEPSSDQYCRGDRVRGLDPLASIPGPACLLRDWVPYRKG